MQSKTPIKGKSNGARVWNLAVIHYGCQFPSFLVLDQIQSVFQTFSVSDLHPNLVSAQEALDSQRNPTLTQFFTDPSPHFNLTSNY